jgi:hypothetical protein
MVASKTDIEELWRSANSLAKGAGNLEAEAKQLKTHPPGYRILFSLVFVDSEIRNGGISQLYANSTWRLMPHAIEAASLLNLAGLANTLREIVYYYHQNNRSKLKKVLPPDLFLKMPRNWSKSLDTLERDYYSQFPLDPRISAKHYIGAMLIERPELLHDES